MAITKVTRTLLSTGIVDNSNATAITIDSSENLTFSNSIIFSDSSYSAAYSIRRNADALILSGGTSGYYFNRSDNSATDLYINGSGNVGIGTDSPSEKLEVSNTSGGASILIKTSATDGGNLLFGDTDSNSVGRVRYDHSANAMQFYANAAERMRIDSSGNVGIGTSSPSAALETFGGTSFIGAKFKGYSGGKTALVGGDLNTVWFGDDDGSIGTVNNFNIRGAANTAKIVTNSVARVTVDGSGNVGIGTDSPNAPLTVSSSGTKTVKVQNTTSSGTSIFVQNSTTGTGDTDGAYFGLDGSENVALWNYESTDMKFATSSSERMRIDSSGNLLVGGTSAVTSSKMLVDFSSGGRGIAVVAASNANGSQSMHFYAGTTQVGSVTVDGSSTSYNTSSDYRLKENVDYDFTALDRVAQLKPARFNFIADADNTVDGFLAHEVQDIVPEAITGEKDAVDDEGNPEYQGIDQSRLVPLLTKAIQELSDKVDNQQTIIDDLKTRIETLESA